ncbi:MAG: DEAD/DEAH RNA helicase [Microgenomates group bacterium GW2011_GWA2_40_6]|nr:MAG: DEAD/DEAH RNA helicase [Microgenomates group bacterium GW2011_GWA2_40_6]
MYHQFSGASRPHFNNRGPSRGFNSPRRPRFSAQKINPALFVKAATAFQKIEDLSTVNSFSDFNLHPTLLTNIKTKGFISPTSIQDQAILPILEKRDVLGIADTGTGKTAAFAIPLINRILKNPSERILIMAPTRELAMQIKQDIRSLTPGLLVYLALAIGGAHLREQIVDIKRGPHIIVGTPGRIKDLNSRHVIDFSRMTVLVLDEVDRMLDMGFIHDIKFIVDQIPKTRQTLFFSATVDRKIESLIGTFLNNPVKLSIKTQSSAAHIEQDIVRVSRALKEQKLQEMMALPEFKKVLVFGATQRMVEKLSISLSAKGFKAQSLHGGKPQNKRTQVIKMYRENVFNILVATDVAARGLDIADITHVINYDQPNNYDDYIHRIGRTGRGDARGFALTFVE